METSDSALSKAGTVELQDDMDRLSLDDTLCSLCSSLGIDTCLGGSGTYQSVTDNSLYESAWKAVTRLDPKCRLCQFVALAIPRAVKEIVDSTVQSQKVATKRDTLLKSSEVIGLRVVPLRMVTDISVQSLHTEKADSIPVIELNLCVLESIGDSPSGHLFPRKFLNCLIPTRKEFRHFQGIKPSQVDFELISSLHGFCVKSHSTGCGKTNTQLAVPNFKVINCDERRIVPHTEGPYLALSYVWGRLSTHSQRVYRANDLLEVVPQTIQDAISVTKALGYRYLWVDRYCVDQSKQIEVQEQVALMDLIYEHAEMTIVAAGGEDPSYGLPGVSTRLRPPAATSVVSGLELRALPHNPVDLVRHSKWNTRGWTYQEGLLSRRRVIFTDSEVYFDCWGM